MKAHDYTMFSTGIMRGYIGRGLDGTCTVPLIETRQAMRHAAVRLHRAVTQAKFPVLFVDLEGITLPAPGKGKTPYGTQKLMHFTRAYKDHGTIGSLMQVATITGECILIDLFSF
ncbi:MAG: hypothetical protein GY739_15435, partial [Mesoflavibacter sp.]|nr:hypothetical protein [Mesoflavibacter sp.]MCP4054418.1 hypothetical protein [Mesoflavibacter sp.]